MKCPFCRQTTTEVYNSRSTRFGSQTWRRRRCLHCHESFTTYEAPDLGFLKIVNKSGHRQRYSRAKLYSDIYNAFEAISQKDSTIDAVTVEAKILDMQKHEVPTDEITRIVLSTLKHFNTAAFLRFLARSADLSSNSQLKRELKKY
jgi:transcriptional repressor NrdR